MELILIKGSKRARNLVWGLLVALALLANCSFAVRYFVGNEVGWTWPAYGPVNYDTWASNYTFHVGDTLVFKYDATYHNVLVVKAEDYISCTSTNATQTFRDGNTVIQLKDAGEHNYICGMPSHCSMGQKLRIQVN